ncbi:hypothetical protein C0Q70_14357 [Pomacea canaliculata]|uniref:Importin N-terminal domain-containing protein n=1 Tax=Pomacea canaliculata TaxID=400727 RepID=A0A2T7NZT9_POMCA|nr:hypothetical protein C0Q70_14357 [Pomacea canaliculata]
MASSMQNLVGEQSTGIVMEQVFSTLVAAVEKIMNPSATPQERTVAHQICEEFREKSPVCLQCGMMLAGKQFSPVVRHFGLQIVEHFIKFRWSEVTEEQRELLKSQALELIDKGTFPLLEEELHIKDAVSRILVELIKRLWPQLWPDLFPHLSESCHHGSTQTELVLKVLLRLVEDIVVFQNIPAQRRREILQAFTSILSQLFQIFLQLLDRYRNPSGTTGKVEDRRPILVMFNSVAMKAVLDAAGVAAMNLQEEHRYLFLKRCCQVLTEMGRQLCALWGQVEDIGQPVEFDTYLKALLAFTQHPSLMLRSCTFSLWTAFIRHPEISKNPVLLSFLPQLVEVCTGTLYKVGLPSLNNSPSCEYSRVDFDNDEDFLVFFTRYRTDSADTIRYMTLLAPELTFLVASKWLQTELSKPVQADKAPCSLSSPEYLEWEALTIFTESVMLRLFQSDKQLPDISLGIQLLQQLLAYQNQDPLIQSCALSCMSALFPFLRHSPTLLPSVLEKIFASVVFSLPGQTKSTRSRAVKNVRQHGCSFLVKICKEHPDILFPEFDHLYVCIKNIDADPEQLSQMERCILIEALIIVSNQFADFERQSAFIAEVLNPVKQMWSSPEFTEAFSHPSKLMSYIGLNQKPVQPSSADTCGINRSHIMYCITMILIFAKRTTWPEDLNAAERGGFVLCKSEDGSVILRNPATAHITHFLDNLFALIRTFCCLWLPEFMQQRHPEFAKAYDLQENERLAALGAFLKPLISYCPRQYYATVAVPVLCGVCPAMFQKLSARWLVINQRYEDGVDRDDESAESQEVLEDQLTRQLTREYLELIITVCTSRLSSKVEVTEEMAMDEEVVPPQFNRNEKALSELGLLCMRTEALFPSLLLCVLSGITWSDTICCTRCVSICWLLVKQLITDNVMRKDGAVHVFSSVLTGLQIHGQHDGMQALLVSLALTVYEEMRPQYPELKDVLLSIPGCTEEAVQNFEKTFLQGISPQKMPPEKKKKEVFKNLISSIIGKSIGQQFKREASYKNLPPMFVRRSRKNAVDVIETGDDSLCSLFAGDDV